MVDKTEKDIDTISSDFVKGLNETILTVSPVPVTKFKTNFTDNHCSESTEHNSGEYIIDDSQYIDIKQLLKRARKADPSALAFLHDVPTIDGSEYGIPEQVIDEVVNNSETGVSVDNSNELSTGETERPQESSEVSNPVDNLTDDSQSESNGK